MAAAQSTDELFKCFAIELAKCCKLILDGDERTELLTVMAWGRGYVGVKVSRLAVFHVVAFLMTM